MTDTARDAKRDATRDATWDAMLLVGQVARTHGLQGHVLVNPETDFVELRFAPGARLFTLGRGDAAGTVRPLVVVSSRLQGARPIVSFEGIEHIDDAEGLIGCELRIPETEAEPLEDGRVYEFQLVGCTVERLVGGVPMVVGRVVRVEGGAGGSRLIVEAAGETAAAGGDAGRELQIPFATAICVEVDVAGQRIRIDPPEGLLELNAPAPPRERQARRPGAQRPWHRRREAKLRRDGGPETPSQ